MYWCTALLKSGAEWTQDGTAIYYALSLDQLLMPVGRLLYPYPDLLRFLTFAVYYTELLLPFALFVPFGWRGWRGLVIGVLFLMHLGISLTLFVGIFFLVNWASLTGLLPPVAPRLASASPTSFGPTAGATPGRVAGPLAAPWCGAARCACTCTPTWSTRPRARRLRHYVGNTVVSVLLAYICWWNLDTIAPPAWNLPAPGRWVGFLTRIDQHWGMFAPAVFKDDGWFILDGNDYKRPPFRPEPRRRPRDLCQTGLSNDLV